MEKVRYMALLLLGWAVFGWGWAWHNTLYLHEDSQRGFRIQLPGSWQAQELTVLGYPVAGFVSSPEGFQDTFLEYLTVDVEELVTPTSLEAYVQELVYLWQLIIPGLQVLQIDDVTVANLPAKLMVASIPPGYFGPIALTSVSVILISASKAYVLTFFGEPVKLPQYQEMMGVIFSSFTPLSIAVTPPPVTIPQPPQPQPVAGFQGVLAVGETRTGTFSPEEHRFHVYTVEVPAGVQVLTVQVDGRGSNIDLALKMGSPITSYAPEGGDYDYADFGLEPSHSYTLTNPQQGTLYLSVIRSSTANAPVTYNLSVVAGEVPRFAADDPFAGTFLGDAFRLELQGENGRYTGRIFYGEQVFLVTAQGANNTLSGTFEANGNRFAFSAQLEGDTLTFATGERIHKLTRQAVEPQ